MEAVLPFDSNPHMTNENGTLESTWNYLQQRWYLGYLILNKAD